MYAVILVPYKSVKSLPKSVQGLPSKAKRIFLKAFNASYEKYGEERAFKIAWSAVKRVFRKKGNKWVRIKESRDEAVVKWFLERMKNG